MVTAKLNVLVVGAGIGGLHAALALAADGHQVTVFESAKAFENVGAGIRVSPSFSKLSQSWGVDFGKVKKEVSQGNRFLDWKGNPLLDVPLDHVQDKYGAPYYLIHRADLVDLLVKTVEQKPNVTIRLQCRVEEYNFDHPSIKLASGEIVHGDIIIVADGIKSSVRDIINGRPVPPQDTGDSAYRVLVPAQPLLDDLEMAHLVQEPWATHWLGPEAHAVGYPLREGELYNIILDVTHTSALGDPLSKDLANGAAEWKSARSNDELVQRFKDWCPEVRRLCEMAGDYLKWRLADFDSLDEWVHPSGKVALLGDACHPMMPYMAQGAAQSVEDAATLAAALREYNSIPEALKAYEAQRKPRTTYIARNTRVLQQWWHLYDGPVRDSRDEMMRNDSPQNPIYWGDSNRNEWLFGHDASQLQANARVPDLPPLPPKEASVYEPSMIFAADG